MPSGSSAKLAVVRCTATLVVFAQGVTARKPVPDLGPLQATPILDLSSFLGVPNRALGLNGLGTVVGSRNVYGLPRGFS